jgi:hypothetical protein
MSPENDIWEDPFDLNAGIGELAEIRTLRALEVHDAMSEVANARQTEHASSGRQDARNDPCDEAKNR